MCTSMLILRRIKIEWDRRTDDDASNNPIRVGGMRLHLQHRATIKALPSPRHPPSPLRTRDHTPSTGRP